MSKFCGKCDVYDVVRMIHEYDNNSNWDNLTIYQYKDDEGRVKEKLNIKSVKDLVPYYPYIEYAGGSTKNTLYLYIGPHSFIYTEEKEMLMTKLKQIKSEYQKCKRKNETFIPEEIAKKLTYFGTISDTIMELCKRVEKHPYTKNISGITDSNHNYYREQLMKEMCSVGYTKEQAYEWCYNEEKTW